MRMYCRHCREGQEIGWHERRPAKCDACQTATPQASDWLQSNEPKRPWALTVMDRWLLWLFYIAQD